MRTGKRNYIFCALACIMSLQVAAAPARRVWQTGVTPEGKTVTVRQNGDEYYHYWETKDGQLAEKQADGSFIVTAEQAPTPEQRAARRAARMPQKVGQPNLAPRGLVILASYQDVAIADYNTQAAIDSMMNLFGYDYHGSTGSASEYFSDQSNGQYVPVFDVVGPVTLPNNRAYYGRNTGGDGTDVNPRQMIVDACKLVDDQVDFTLYNNDGDNLIDFVYVIYAGIGENDRNSVSDAVWAHNNSAASMNCWLDGLKLSNYACSGDIDGITLDRNGIGVVCHEFGHVIGLPDYYDASRGENVFWEWSIMDYGCYNHDALTPPNYSIFDKYFMGWATPKFLPKDSALTIHMTAAYDDAYQIAGGDSLEHYNSTQTIYYIENRQPVSWDAYLPGHGMIVWRVEYNQSKWNSNRVNETSNVIRYSVVSAKWGLMNGSLSSAEDPFPGSIGKQTFTPIDGCELTEITEEEGVLSFLYNGGAPDTPAGIESIQNSGFSIQKTLRDGQLLILRGDKWYTATGTIAQ